jgi:hypothetical protein
MTSFRRVSIKEASAQADFSAISSKGWRITVWGGFMKP